jgi:hypothetical protein
VNANKRAWNAAIGKVRGRIEKVFGTAKRTPGSRSSSTSPSSPTI